MGKRELLKIGREFEKLIFFLHFLAGDFSLNNFFITMQLCRHLVNGGNNLINVTFMVPS